MLTTYVKSISDLFLFSTVEGNYEGCLVLLIEDSSCALNTEEIKNLKESLEDWLHWQADIRHTKEHLTK